MQIGLSGLQARRILVRSPDGDRPLDLDLRKFGFREDEVAAREADVEHARFPRLEDVAELRALGLVLVRRHSAARPEGEGRGQREK